jgi:hypothetical protein
VGSGQNPRSYSEFGDLAEHVRFVERGSRKMARSTFYALGRYQAKLEQRTTLLGRIVDIGSELYAIAAACVYANTLAGQDSGRRAEVFELAELFCSQARRRVDTLFSELWSNDDDAGYKAAQKVLAGRYRWLEAEVLDPAGEGPMIPEHEKPAAEKLQDAPAPDEDAPERVQAPSVAGAPTQ